MHFLVHFRERAQEQLVLIVAEQRFGHRRAAPGCCQFHPANVPGLGGVPSESTACRTGPGRRLVELPEVTKHGLFHKSRQQPDFVCP